MASFSGTIGLVTGAGRGIGRATALALAKSGATVAVHYRQSRRAATEVLEEMQASGGSGLLVQADLTRGEEVVRMFQSIDEIANGLLDFLVNNAGEWMDKRPIVECDEADWDRMMAVNCNSVFLCCREAARRMIPRRSGAIVNVGSVAGHTGGGGGTVPYAAAKAAVHTLTRGLARELGGQGIRVNGVAPGVVDTEMLQGRISEQADAALNAMTPLGRRGKPEEIAAIILLLLSPGASFMTGEIVDVNGGLLMR